MFGKINNRLWSTLQHYHAHYVIQCLVHKIVIGRHLKYICSSSCTFNANAITRD